MRRFSFPIRIKKKRYHPDSGFHHDQEKRYQRDSETEYEVTVALVQIGDFENKNTFVKKKMKKLK